MPEKRSHGGRRPGAGRRQGSGPYGEPTRPVRVPVSLVPQVKGWLAATVKETGRKTELPGIYRPAAQPLPLPLTLYTSRVAAGFPSPADDYVEGQLDLNDLLVKHPAATFYVRVTGDSMIDAGIHPDDILVVDRAIEPASGKVVIAVLNGELTVKRLIQDRHKVTLMPENSQYAPIEVTEEMDFMIWGVATNVVHRL